MDYNNILSQVQDGILYLTIIREENECFEYWNYSGTKAIDQAYNDKNVHEHLTGAGEKSLLLVQIYQICGL